MEEFIVEWNPEDCTLNEAQQQPRQGFVVTSIISLDDGVPTALLETATAAKRPKGRPMAADRPPPDTRCRVQFDPSPKGPTHIRTIKGGEANVDRGFPINRDNGDSYIAPKATGTTQPLLP